MSARKIPNFAKSDAGPLPAQSRKTIRPSVIAVVQRLTRRFPEHSWAFARMARSDGQAPFHFWTQ
ncbi:MAG: hypothetical protein L0Y58_04530 [Verrucomicrobia subdivision 3 bacterium]|nr:hypothetical protein [Limisphaerales bacterium]